MRLVLLTNIAFAQAMASPVGTAHALRVSRSACSVGLCGPITLLYTSLSTFSRLTTLVQTDQYVRFETQKASLLLQLHTTGCGHLTLLLALLVKRVHSAGLEGSQHLPPHTPNGSHNPNSIPDGFA